MRISPRASHWRVYLAWQRRKTRTDHEYRHRWVKVGTYDELRDPRPREIDLCHYMRVVFIHAPWRWFWQGYPAIKYPRIEGRHAFMPWFALLLSGLLGAAAGSIYLWPLQVLLAALTMVGIVGVSAAIAFGGMWFFSNAFAREVREKDEAPVRKVGRGIRHAWRATRSSLIVEWLRAKKQRVCPLIEVKGGGE